MWNPFRKKHISVKVTKPIGSGAFRVIQNGHYITLLTHEKDVIAQKFISDGELYDELFDYITAKLGGRIPFPDERDSYE